MLTLLSKGVPTKLLKFFSLKIFFICHRCQRHRWSSLSCEYFREFSKKFETVPMGYSEAGGKLIDEKNQKQKISWHCPFNLRSIFPSTAESILCICFSYRRALHLSSYCKFLALFSSFLYNKEQLYIRGSFHSAVGLIPHMYRMYSTVDTVQIVYFYYSNFCNLYIYIACPGWLQTEIYVKVDWFKKGNIVMRVLIFYWTWEYSCC